MFCSGCTNPGPIRWMRPASVHALGLSCRCSTQIALPSARSHLGVQQHQRGLFGKVRVLNFGAVHNPDPDALRARFCMRTAVQPRAKHWQSASAAPSIRHTHHRTYQWWSRCQSHSASLPAGSGCTTCPCGRALDRYGRQPSRAVASGQGRLSRYTGKVSKRAHTGNAHHLRTRPRVGSEGSIPGTVSEIFPRCH